MKKAAVLICAALFATGCAAQRAEVTRTLAEPDDEVPLLDGTGAHERPITTTSPDAQRYFNQGLRLLYAFNHDEAVRSFERASELDPTSAMPWWGLATALGPHINNPSVPPEAAAKAWDAVQKAKARLEGASEVERALVLAVEKRWSQPVVADRRPLDEAYAEAMRQASQRFFADADIGALYAEALMDLRPWDLWKADGSPQPG